MSKIKSANTKAELVLRKALWKEGIRYRINNKALPGKPDLSIKKHKVVIFIDGEFWHGYNWEVKKKRIKSNKEYWIKKIEKNIERDKKITEYYMDNNWTIFRIWESQLIASFDLYINEIIQQIKNV